MYTRILKNIPKLRSFLVLVYMGVFTVNTSNAQTSTEDRLLFGSVRAESQIIGVAGSTVKLNGFASSHKNSISTYCWDFDGDGTVDWTSDQNGFTSHIYTTAGEYNAYFSAIETDGEVIPAWKVSVIIVQNESEIDSVRESLESQNVRALPSVRNPADGIENRYALIINGNPGSDLSMQRVRFWDDMEYLYDMLLNKGFTKENIILLHYNGKDIYGRNEDNMIDDECTKETIYNACSELAAKVDEDDVLYVWTDDHGHGYSRVSPPAPTEEYIKGAGHLGSPASIDEDDEKDYPEDNFKLRALCSYNDQNHYETYYHGMNKWIYDTHLITKNGNVERFITRVKIVSRIDDIYFTVPNQNITDTDTKIEKIFDFLKGDLNHNGIIESGEKADWNNNGISGYNSETGVFDEEDWGEVDRYTDDYNNLEFLLPDQFSSYRIFDAGNNKVAIDFDPIDIENGPFTADGIDTDNDGLFDKVDLNQDGDFDDWVSIDEVLVLLNGVITDDELKSMLDMVQTKNKVVIMHQCFSGGFVEDLSAPGTVIYSSTEEETVSWNNCFIRNVITAFSGENIPESTEEDPALADIDNDGYINTLEAFIFASKYDIPHQLGRENPVYDDNADKVYSFENDLDYNNLGDVGRVGRTIFLDKDISIFHNILLQNLNISGSDNYAAGIKATVENSDVQSGASMNVRSGKDIVIKPNFHAQKGSSVKLTIE